MDDGDKLPLLIPVKAVSEYLQCPICIGKLKLTHITPCGHRYCGKCIKECVNRRPKCPICNKKVKADELLSDWEFDNLIGTVADEENKAEKNYFVNLIAAHHSGGDTNHREVSPIESTLQKHLKLGLASYEQYFQDLQKEFAQRIQTVEAEIQAFSGGEDDVTMAQCLQDLEAKRQDLETERRTCIQLLVDAYDKYLTDHLPTPSLLPVTISVRLQQKGITLQDVKLKPHSSLSEVKEIVLSTMKARGDAVVSSLDDVQYILLGPIQKGQEISNELLQELSSVGAERSEVIRLLSAGCHPVLDFAMKPGSEVVLVGSVKLESELPKQCFAFTFDKDKKLSMDYFTCKDCSFNWVCQSCRDYCHKDHQTVPYIMGHQPTWACCYCPRKKKCQLEQITN